MSDDFNDSHDQGRGTEHTENHDEAGVWDQDVINAWVELQNAVFQLLCFLSGQRGEMPRLDSEKLRQFVDAHPEEDLGWVVRDTVERALADCGVL